MKRKMRLEQQVQEEMAELRKANEALRQSAEAFRLLIDSISDYAIFMLNPAGHVTSWNAGAERIKGYRADEILGRNFSCFYPAEDLAAGKPPRALQVAAAEGRFEDEGWRVRKDGSRFWASVLITALRDARGNLVGFSKVTHDLTERRRAEEALQASRSELAHMARVKTLGELTASIAHEINQPLTSVVTNANACRRLLAGDSPDVNEARLAVKEIAKAGTLAGEVISRIRALTKTAAAEMARLNINEAIREVLPLLRTELQHHQVTVRAEMTEGLPIVLGDRVQLQQVILNLVMNAIEAMASIPDLPRVLVIRSRTDESGGVLVAVKDSGVGIDARNVDRIFNTFFTTKPGGMGMGLSISRSIIEAHAGRLVAMGNDGPGATFQFSLPPAARLS